jgi:hypothetical protein
MDDLTIARTHQEAIRESEQVNQEEEERVAQAHHHRATETSGSSALPLVSVFSPTAVFWVAFLMNLLGGFILSALNWSRLESPAKARAHVAVGGIVFIGLTVLIARAPISATVVLLINLVGAFYLRRATQTDIADEEGVTKRVDIINGWAAFGIGLLCALVMGLLVLLLRPAVA